MRLATTLALMGALFCSPVLAQDAPVGTYYCADVYGVPVGIFTITGAGTYAWQAIQTVDYKTFKDDPSNGSGSFVMDGEFLIISGGNFKGEFGDPSAKVVTNSGGVQLWFANNGGGLLNCAD